MPVKRTHVDLCNEPHLQVRINLWRLSEAAILGNSFEHSMLQLQVSSLQLNMRSTADSKDPPDTI